jgi:hypothetical protein
MFGGDKRSVRAQHFEKKRVKLGEQKKTSGGLTADDIMKNKRDVHVSKKMHTRGVKLAAHPVAKAWKSHVARVRSANPQIKEFKDVLIMASKTWDKTNHAPRGSPVATPARAPPARGMVTRSRARKGGWF